MTKFRDSISGIILQGIRTTGHNFQHGMGYHTDKHAVEVVDSVIEILESFDCFTQTEKNSLLIAAAWHDAIYKVGSISNENDSALKLMWCHSHSEKFDLELSMQLIRGTQVANHLSEDKVSPLQEILLDADLVALSLPYDEFYYRQVLILKEHGLNESSIDKSYMFLKQFLNKKTIYRTKYAIDKWEASARSNIESLK